MRYAVSRLLLRTFEFRASTERRTMAVTSAGRYEDESRDSTTPNRNGSRHIHTSHSRPWTNNSASLRRATQKSTLRLLPFPHLSRSPLPPLISTPPRVLGAARRAAEQSVGSRPSCGAGRGEVGARERQRTRVYAIGHTQ